ncbi:MAG: DNA glycosylase [Armatimonadota bacterium]
MTLHPHNLVVSPTALDAHATIFSGQLFRFTSDDAANITGVQGQNVIQITQTPNAIFTKTSNPDPATLVKDFFALETIDLNKLAEQWSNIPLFDAAWQNQPGIRINKQDPHECIFAFLCASAAPISRISQMLNTLARNHGTLLAPGLHAFPTLEQLHSVTETDLRSYGFGFRAPRIIAAANYFHTNSITPAQLAALDYNDLVCTLTKIDGCGRKIADCIALFAFQHHHAVPVDTHIWKIARNHFVPQLADLSLTPKTYQLAVDAFHDRFGDYAGWAQQILFYQQATRNPKSNA